MQVIEKIADLETLPGPLHLAIGVFDGVHLGHRAVIEAAEESARLAGGTAVVVTFDPHPVEVLKPELAPRLLTDTPHKLLVLGREFRLGAVLLVRFDADFASLSGESFVGQLLAAAEEGGIARICVGRSWRFGKGRSGDLALLERLGEAHGFSVSGIDTVELGGDRVSSTRVRESVAAGDLDTAALLLGRRYSVHGPVVRGRQLGRTIGFPTANLSVNREQLPPPGVYAVVAGGSAGRWEGVANLGHRPTVEGGGAELKLEVHLFGVDRELYGEDLEVEFVAWIRPEQRFDGLDALKEQIRRDADEALAIHRKTATIGEMSSFRD